jgi:hypothetical protein
MSENFTSQLACEKSFALCPHMTLPTNAVVTALLAATTAACCSSQKNSRAGLVVLLYGTVSSLVHAGVAPAGTEVSLLHCAFLLSCFGVMAGRVWNRAVQSGVLLSLMILLFQDTGGVYLLLSAFLAFGAVCAETNSRGVHDVGLAYLAGGIVHLCRCLDGCKFFPLLDLLWHFCEFLLLWRLSQAVSHYPA